MEELSRYKPTSSIQKTSLKTVLRAVAFAAQAEEREESFAKEAREEAVRRS